MIKDKVIDTITYIKSVSKKKLSIDRTKTHLLKIGDENVWSTKAHKLINDSYKIRERKLVEETLA